MKISEFLKESFIDYPGKISLVVFTAGCNYRCPACHAKEIVYGNGKISEEEIFSYLGSRKGWINGVVLCGGEPTLQPDLPEFARKLKGTGVSVKLDTNGSNLEILEVLLKEKTIDYVALDVKGPRNLYNQLTGTDNNKYTEESMRIVQKFPDYEYRTTIVPVENNGAISWLKIIDYENMAKWIVNATGNNQHKHYLQKFVARSKEEMVDERFSKENLLKEMHETPNSLMQEIQERMIKYLPNCKIR